MPPVVFDDVQPIIGARDLEASIRFYVARLGFALTFRDGSTPTNYVGLNRGGVELHMQFQHDDEMSALRLRIRVDDPDVLHSEYQSNGVTTATPLENKPWGTREFAVFDPDRNALTFYRSLKAGE
jgi:catechol 2,3-dioxygenase-like lactoylglutathione lyase family enzyme